MVIKCRIQMQSDKIFGCFKLLTDIDVSIKPSISSETKHFIEEEKLFFSLSNVIATSTYICRRNWNDGNKNSHQKLKFSLTSIFRKFNAITRILKKNSSKRAKQQFSYEQEKINKSIGMDS